MARNAARLAAEVSRQGIEPLVYQAELLEMEVAERAERRAVRRTKEAGFPLIKTLEGFDFRRGKGGILRVEGEAHEAQEHCVLD